MEICAARVMPFYQLALPSLHRQLVDHRDCFMVGEGGGLDMRRKAVI